MRKLGVVIPAVILAACSQQHDADNSQVDWSAALPIGSKIISERIQREYIKLTSSGQGCVGNVLKNSGLKNAVIGKVIREDINKPIRNSISYFKGGRFLATPTDWGVDEGRYWFKDDKICRTKHWCVRLIRSQDGKMMEERFNLPDHGRPSLECMPVTNDQIGEEK